MPSTNSLHRKSAFPSLLASNNGTQYATVPLLKALGEGQSDKTDFRSLLKEAAADSGFEFLFEIPGALFDDENINAFVIRYVTETENYHSFVVHDPESGKISIMTYEEITTKARKFFSSYYGVLSCLSKISSVKKLN